MELRQKQTDYSTCRGSRRILPTGIPNFSLHRIATVIEQEGVSARTIANRLGETEGFVNSESHPASDMLLSDLYRWRAALRVPISELLVEAETELSPPIQLRTRLLKLMRSVRSIQEQSTEDSIQTLAMQLSNQLLEMMPELKKVTGWPVVGQMRRSRELGEIAYNIIPEVATSSQSDWNAE